MTWCLGVPIRTKGASEDARYWLVSAIGYAAFSVAYGILEIWDALSGDFDARSVPFTLIVLALALGSMLASRRAAARTPS